jgi:hypothetical protein
LPGEAIVKGLLIGSSLIAGHYIAKRFVLSSNRRGSASSLDALMFVSGAAMLWSAVR